jgi:hypothetical protein
MEVRISKAASGEVGFAGPLFCGLTTNFPLNSKGPLIERVSDAFCCALAELPAGDLLFCTKGAMQPISEYQERPVGSCAWTGRSTLGARLCWAFGRDYREAIRRYYLALVRSGVVHKKTTRRPRPRLSASPQFNTWGAEVGIDKVLV